jgi:CYTH domain-containing protein
MTSQITALPKYAIFEIERRWLVDLAQCPKFDQHAAATITDRYIDQSLLRLRKVERASGELTYKFCKKYERFDPLAQPIVNVYLSADEYDLLNKLPGRVVVKRRYPFAEGAIDVYLLGDVELAILEVEFETVAAAATYTPPSLALDEVTHNPRYSGASLAGGSSQY